MKKKGFTLIELIVVIAIIGVLAAILVPAMLGYVRKSKITTANTTAKSIYNAMNSTLVEMDTADKTPPASSTADNNGAEWTGSLTGTSDEVYFKNAVYTYFSDIIKVKKFAYTIENGACTATGVLNGSYPGAYPKVWDVTMFKSANNTVANAEAAMNNAYFGTSSSST